MQLMTVNNLTFDHDLTEYFPETDHQWPTVRFRSESGALVAAIVYAGQWIFLRSFWENIPADISRRVLDREGWEVDMAGRRKEWWGILLDLAVEAGLEIPAAIE